MFPANSFGGTEKNVAPQGTWMHGAYKQIIGLRNKDCLKVNVEKLSFGFLEVTRGWSKDSLRIWDALLIMWVVLKIMGRFGL